MRKLAFFVALLAITTNSFGQSKSSEQRVKFGVKFGITTNSIDITNIGSNPNSIDSHLASKGAGYTLGLMSRIKISSSQYYLQPELLFNHLGYRFYNTDGKKSKLGYNNIYLPVLAGMNIAFLRVNAGPVFNIGSFKSSKQDIIRPEVGYQLGAGLTLGKIDFDIRYQGDFSKKIRNFNWTNANEDIKVNSRFWVFSLGYFFNSK